MYNQNTMQNLSEIISGSGDNIILDELKQDEYFNSDLKKLEDLSLEYIAKYGKIKINLAQPISFRIFSYNLKYSYGRNNN